MADKFAVFQTSKGPVAYRVLRNPHPDIEVSEDVLHHRDGNHAPSEGDIMQIVVDSRDRHRSVVPAGEQSTYHLSDHEVVNVTETVSPNGERRKRYQLRRKD